MLAFSLLNQLSNIEPMITSIDPRVTYRDLLWPSINDILVTFLGWPFALPFPWASQQNILDHRKFNLTYRNKIVQK